MKMLELGEKLANIVFGGFSDSEGSTQEVKPEDNTSNTELSVGKIDGIKSGLISALSPENPVRQTFDKVNSSIINSMKNVGKATVEKAKSAGGNFIDKVNNKIKTGFLDDQQQG